MPPLTKTAADLPQGGRGAVARPGGGGPFHGGGGSERLTPRPRRRRLVTSCDLAAVYQEMLRRGELAGFEVTERFYEIGSVAGLAETREHLAGRV